MERNEIKKLMLKHEDFALDCIKLKDNFTPQFVYSRDGKLIVGLLMVDRDISLSILRKIKQSNPEWIITMHEGWHKIVPISEKDKYKHGTLAKEFKENTKDVERCIIVQYFEGDFRLALISIIDKNNKVTDRKFSEKCEGAYTLSD